MLSGRTSLFVALLLIEVVLIVSLRTVGWLATGGAIRWMACLLAALLPLVVAAGMLINKRRFSLQSLFAVVALVAVFLGVSALPLYEFHHARRLAKQLVSANATLHTDSSLDDFYSQIRYVPRPAPSIRTVGYDLPPWLKPFAGNSSAIPPDETVQEIWLDSDDQISTLCSAPSLLRNLTCISVAPGVTAAGMEELRTTLPKFPRLTHIHVSSVKIPKNWLPSLVNIRSLWILGRRLIRWKPPDRKPTQRARLATQPANTYVLRARHQRF